MRRANHRPNKKDVNRTASSPAGSKLLRRAVKHKLGAKSRRISIALAKKQYEVMPDGNNN